MKRFQKENYFSKIEKKIQLDNVMEFPSLSDVMAQLQSENKEKKKLCRHVSYRKRGRKKRCIFAGLATYKYG